MKINEFASKIKSKYPEYEGIDDTTLVNKIIEKYPVYRDQIDFDDDTPEAAKVDNPSAKVDTSNTRQPVEPIEPVDPYRGVGKNKDWALDTLKDTRTYIAPDAMEEATKSNQFADKTKEIGAARTPYDYPQPIEYKQEQDDEINAIKQRSEAALKAKTWAYNPVQGMGAMQVHEDKDGETWQAAYSYLEAAEKIKEANNKGLLGGIGDALTDVNTYTSGLKELNNDLKLQEILRREESGVELTQAENDLLDAAAYHTLATLSADPSIAYQIGQSLPESAAFMAQMFATGGVGAASGNVGGKLAQRYVSRYGKKTLLKLAGKAAGQAAAVTGTFGSGSVASDYVGRTTGDVIKTGDGQYRIINQEDNKATALYKATASQFIENLTEVGGGVLSPILAPIKRTGGRIVPGAIKKALSSINSSEIVSTMQDLTKRMAWDGIPEEYMEEVVGTVLNSMFVGDSSFSDLLDVEQQLVTLGSVALMSGTMGSVQGIGYGVDRYKTAKEVETLYNNLSKAGYDPDAIINDDGGIIDPATFASMSIVDKQLLAKYYVAKQRMEGLKLGVKKRSDEAGEQAAQSVIDNSNIDTNTTVRATIDDSDEEVAVIGGDYTQGDDAVLTIKREDGSTEQVIGKRIKIEQVEDTEELAKKAKDDAAQEILKQEAESVSYRPESMPVPGKVVTIAGEKHTVTSIDGESVMLTSESGMPMQMGLYEVRDMIEDEMDQPVLEVGQEIQLNNTTMQVLAIQPDGVILRAEDGSTTKLPHDAVNAALAASISPDATIPTDQQQMPTEAEQSPLQSTEQPVPGDDTVSTTEQATEQPASGIEPVQTEEQEVVKKEYPRDKEGNIDYDSIQDHNDFGNAMIDEFGADTALLVLDEQLTNIEKKAAKAGSKGDAIAKARAKKKYEQERNRFIGARKVIEAAIEANQQAKLKQEMEAAKEVAQQDQAQGSTQPTERKQEAFVPEFELDRAEDARARGYRNQNGNKVYRSEEVHKEPAGAETTIKFGTEERDQVKGRYHVVESNTVHPSHTATGANPMHFIPEAQIKDRAEAVSNTAAEKIASKNDPIEVTNGVTAFVGTPIINTRGEAVQGNNRSRGLAHMYKFFPDKAEAYKQYLIDNASRFGLDPQVIAGMKNPILVRVIDVNDDEAIRLGNKSALDTESGGEQRIDPVGSIKMLGDSLNAFANILYRSNNEEDAGSLNDTVRENGKEALKFMLQKNAINDTQYASAFDKAGNLKAEAVEDLINISKAILFQGGKDNIGKMFKRLPDKAKKAILQTIHRDQDGSIKKVLQEAIEVYYLLSQDPSFSKAKSTEDTILASLGWYVQAFMDFAEGSYIPKDRYSPAAVRFAASFKSDKQTDQVKRFNAIFDAIEGISGNLFESVEKLDPEAAIRKYLDNLERYEQFRSAGSNASGRGRPSQERGSGVPEDSGGTNQRSQEDGDADTGRVTASASRTEAGSGKTGDQVGQTKQAGDQSNQVEQAKKDKQAKPVGDQVEQTRDQVRGQVEQTEQTKGQAEQAEQTEQATKTKAKTEDAAKSKIKAKVVERREKAKNALDDFFDSFDDLTDSEKNFGIVNQTSEKQAKVLAAGTRVIAAYTELGIYKFADIITDIVKQGRNISEGLLNAIKKAYGIFLIDNDIDGLDDVRTVRSFTIDDLNRIKEEQKNASNEDISEQEAEVDTNPTEAQKEAGNYKKGHVRISGMDITIEQPKGSTRSGVDANGREWSNTMQNTYGYFKRTQGKDGDQIDVFLGDNVESDKVFVIDQKNPDTGEFDESKVMVGFDTAEQAKDAYMSNYEAGWGGFMAITEQSVDNFKKWLYDGAKQRKPFSEYVGNKKEDTSSMDLFEFADHIAKNQGDNAANPTKNTNLDTTTKTDNTNNQQNVPNQSRDSEQDRTKSSNVDKVDKGSIPGERGRSGGDGNQSDGSSKEGNQQKGSKGGSGLFANLFGKQSDNDVHKSDKGSIPENDGTGNFDGRGSSIDGTKGLHDDNRGHDADKGSVEKAAGTFAERIKQKLKEQKAAESIPVIPGDLTNIRETLPFLLKEQQEDVLKAEKRFTDPKHQTKELGNGKGILFTNGTGTGKTYVGLGIVKRFVKQGKTNILIVTPSQPKVNDWAQDGKNLNLEISPLPDTSTGGTGIVVTTFANFRENDELKKREFDLVIYDESHRLMEEKNGSPSSTTHTHYQITNRDVDTAVSRLTDVHPVWIEYKEILDELRRLPRDISGDMMEDQYAEIQERRKVLDNRIKELDKQKKDLLPGLTEKAKEAVGRTKVVFLSATPFKGHFNLRYVNGYLFNWGDKTTHQQASRVMSRVDAESRFFLDNFGSAYEWKYHRLQSRSNANADAIAMQEVQFAEKLMDQGVMSGRAIESEMDYERSFPKTTGLNTDEINKAFNDIFNYETNEFSQLRASAREVFYNYNYTTQLFESLKAATSIERIQKHLDMGRKVVVFHRRKQGNTTPPFNSILELTQKNAVSVLSDENSSEESRQKATDALNQIERFRSKYDGLLEYEQTLNYDPAVKQLSEAFEGRISFMNGDISKKEKQNAISNFNKDGSGIDIILVQEDSGKEGISLHDTSGKHQRVLMSLSMPISSITALQIEGRIYRIGQETDAIFEYPLLGLDLEVAHFGQNINRKLSTTENLAVGNQSRDLIRSFAEGVLFNSNTSDPSTDQGKGGKEFDKKAQEALSEFRKAVLVYNTNQKLRGKRDAREGVDYYPTPEPVGQKMVEWLGLQVGETAMEPSAGHGAIAMWFPSHVNATVIEPSFGLFSKLNARSGGGDVKALNERFEDHHIVNKYNGIAMNPPFGTGGSTAMKHIEKAFNHLKENGRIVALIPNGGSMQKRLDDFLYGVDDKGKLKNPNAHLIAEIILPSVTFEQAGTAVNGKIIVIDKISDHDAVENIQPTQTINLSGANRIDDLFNGIERVSIPVRNVSKESTDSNVVEVETSSESILKNIEEYTHTKTGATLYNVPLNRSIDNMSSVSRIAGRHNAYNKKYPYSYYSKGFLFKSKEDAIRFKNEVDGETNPTTDEATGNSILNEPAPILNEAIQMQIDWDAQEEAEPVRRAEGFKPDKDSNLNNSYVHKRNGVSNYERILSDRGYLDFMGTSLTGTETITSPDDIAFIMKNLESAASENTFFVLIDKDGGYKVVYMCTGSQVQAVVDMSIVAPAIEQFNAKKVCLVHNHPSGTLNRSDADLMLHKNLKTIGETLGVEVMDSIIINLDSGKYVRFNSNESNAVDTKHDEISANATVKPVNVYQFDRAVLYSPFESWSAIKSSWDIATFLSTQKRGVAKKIQVIILNNKLQITAYYLEDGNISDDKLTAGILKAAGKHCVSVALSTNSDRFDSRLSVSSIQKKMRVANIQLIDVLVIKEDSDILHNFKSFRDSDLLREDAGKYENGTKEDSDVRFRKVSDNGFYSTVEDALERIKQDKGTPEQFKAMLLKNGAKQAELDWMGWDDFASDINVVTKADIQDWIDQNRIEVEEVEKADIEDDRYLSRDDAYDLFNMDHEVYGIDDFGVEFLIEDIDDINNYDRFALEYDFPTAEPTKYSQHTLQGGKNYKELLLTMPMGDKPLSFDEYMDYADMEGSREGYEEYLSDFNKGRDNAASGSFVSKHYSEPNILAHVRFNERTGANGERILFLEEVQSDWAQKGKKEGFKTDKLPDNVKIKEVDGNWQVIVDGRLKGEYKTEQRAKETAMADFGGVPDMPFKKTDQWVNLAFRRMMRYAAENGFDRIAWTTGEQQADRYDLSKIIDTITVKNDGKHADGYTIYKVKSEYKSGQENYGYHKAEELPDIVGKELADKVLSENLEKGESETYSGLDLKVGGEGMKAFYDTIIPKAAGKLGKPFGAKVEAVELPMEGDKATSVQSIPVTDTMTQSVQQGIPLFKEHEYGELPITDAAKQSQIEAFFDKVSKEADNAGQVHVIRSRSELPSNVKNVMPNDARVPGLHITSTGESYFILDEIKDVDEAFKTWVHEVGVHGGLRNVIPSKLFNSMMAKIYDDLGQDEIRRVLPSNYWDLPKHVQAEEYMAHLAEQILKESDLTKRERNAWQKIIEAVYNVLNKLFRNAQFTRKDVENLILASVQSTFTPGNPGGLFPGGSGKGNNQSGVRLKSVKDTREEIQRLNNEIKKSKFIESAQDKMVSVKKLIEEVESSGTKVESWENPYLHENAMTSISTYEIEVYTKNYLEPLIGKYSELVKHLGSEEAAKDYLLAKHGLERNEKMRNDAEEADPEADHSQRDFAGLTSLAERALDLGDADVSELSMEEIEYRFKEFVEQIESEFDTKPLWDSINANTKHTLKKWFDSGMLSKDQYEEIRSMYEYYIPLRGFEEETAGDVYEYMKSNNDNTFQSVVKKTKGRKSLAADPLANISSMATSSIIGGNKNQVKQRMLWMARNHESPVYNVSQVWYVNNGTEEDPLWVEAFPPLTGKESVEERNEIIDAFNRGMKEKEEAGTATTKRKGLRVGLKIGKAQAEEHQVVVFELGKKYVININGDPSVAQAINGTNKYDFRKSPVGKSLQWANRQMAANFTTRNPTFIVRNFVRDVTYASSMHNVREGRAYSNQFKNNIPVAMGAAWRYLRGKGNDSIIDKNFIDFLANGGETGYVNLQSFRDHEKKIKRMIKEVNGTNSIVKGVHAVMEAIEMLNRWAELISRFATYQTSLDMGRSVEVSIANSKDSTVNFNRKGTGKSLGDDTNFALRIASYALPYLSSSQLFFNASVQGLSNFVDAAKKKPGRFAGTLAKYTAVGMVTPIVSAIFSVLLGGSDDEDSIYWDIPTYVRRNNFVLCFGNKYLAIPLPIELRAFYGLGEILSTQMMGKGLNEEPVTEALYGFTDAMIPVEVGQTAFRKLSDSDSYYMGGIMPDFMVPLYEAYVANEDWLGYKVSKDTPFNHYAPQFQKVYSGTNKWLVKSSEMLNTISGGDPVGIRGSFDPILLNPAKIEHLLESYFGGVGKTVNQVAKVTTSIIENAIGAENPQNLELRDIPVLSGFTGSISDERIMQAKRNEFYGFRDQYEKYLHDVRKLRDLDDLYESSKRISEIAESDHGRRMQFYGERKKAYDKLYKRYKELEESGSDSFSLELINDQMNEIIKQTVEEMRNE